MGGWGWKEAKGIKDSTLRYNKVHRWKPSHPSLLGPEHYATQLTLFLNFINFSLGLGGASAPSGAGVELGSLWKKQGRKKERGKGGAGSL